MHHTHACIMDPFFLDVSTGTAAAGQPLSRLSRVSVGGARHGGAPAGSKALGPGPAAADSQEAPRSIGRDGSISLAGADGGVPMHADAADAPGGGA
jgi:hypothetical protein